MQSTNQGGGEKDYFNNYMYVHQYICVHYQCMSADRHVKCMAECVAWACMGIASRNQSRSETWHVSRCLRWPTTLRKQEEGEEEEERQRVRDRAEAGRVSRTGRIKFPDWDESVSSFFSWPLVGSVG